MYVSLSLNIINRNRTIVILYANYVSFSCHEEPYLGFSGDNYAITANSWPPHTITPSGLKTAFSITNTNMATPIDFTSEVHLPAILT